jgi:hypothetical protein
MNFSYHQVVYLIHIFLVAPLFIYLWYRGAYQNKPINKNLLLCVGCLGLFLILYHSYKLYESITLIH